MKKLYQDHPEYLVLTPNEASKHLADELDEFFEDLSWDEFSDVCYAVNRLIGSLFKVKYVRILPFDSHHITKCNLRYTQYGHFRSKKHIV